MYLDELREVQAYLMAKTEVPELKSLNLLGVQYSPGNRGRGLAHMRFAKAPPTFPGKQL